MVSCWAHICGRDSSVKQALPHAGCLLRNTQSQQSKGEAAWEVPCFRGLQTDLCQFLGSAEGVVVMGRGNKTVGLHPGSALRFCLSSFDLFYTLRRVFRFALNEAFLSSFEADPDLILSPRKFKEHVKCYSEAPLNLKILDQSYSSFYYNIFLTLL